MRTKEEAVEARRVSQPATYIVFCVTRSCHSYYYSSGLNFFFSPVQPVDVAPDMVQVVLEARVL